MKKTVFTVSLLLSQLSHSVVEKLYSISGATNSVLVMVWEDDQAVSYREFNDEGIDTPKDALLTFFYLAQQDKKEEIIRIHDKEDGSQDYIRRLLNSTPDALLGTNNLKELSINKTMYWGNERLLKISMEDDENILVNWQENYKCSESGCFKSNSRLFSSSPLLDLTTSIVNVSKIDVSSEIDLSLYTAFDIYPSGSDEYPMTLYFLLSNKIDSKLSDHIKEIENILSSTDDVRSELFNEYLEVNYSSWNLINDISLRFENLLHEKKYEIIDVLGYVDVQYEFYIENEKFSWIVFSGGDRFLKKRGFIFIYNKELKKFVPDTGNGYSDSVLNTLLRNKLVESAFILNDIEE